jgi:pimeloyl-ACP methyl ester carboxylesterase
MGDELPALAARHPVRVARVGYLDAAYDGADRLTPEGSEDAAGPDRFASFEDYLDFVRSVLPDDMCGTPKL